MRKLFVIILLSIRAIQSQSILITEIMQDPVSVSDSNGEYFEVYNAADSVIDMQGWRLRSAGNADHIIDNGGPLLIPSGTYFVFGRSIDTLVNGGIRPDYVFAFGLNNTTDNIVIFDSALTLIDSVAYDGGVTFPDPTGASMVFTGDVTDDNNLGQNWMSALSREAHFIPGLGTDLGSPGTGSFSDAPLPVELSSFEASGGDSMVELKWITASEMNNLGFELFRSSNEDTNYALLSSYLDNENLKGKGNSSEEQIYFYTDYDVFNESIYWYKLVDVSNNGLRRQHGPVQAVPLVAGVRKSEINIPDGFKLHQNYPNPFNPDTNIQIEIPQLKKGPLKIDLNIYNLIGQKVQTLFSGFLSNGIYNYNWNGTDFKGRKVTSGVYFYKVESDDFYSAKRMLLLK